MFALLGLLFLLASPALVAADAPVRFEVRVAQAGYPIRGLKWSDFKAAQGQRVLNIRGATGDDQPLDLVLVLDVSGLMSEQLDYVQVNAELAVSQLQAQDRAAVLTFADKTSVRVPFTSDTDTLLRAITQGVDSNNKWDGGNIDAAVERSAEFVRKSARPDARRIALFITGNMHYREMDGRKLQRAVSASGAVFSAVLTTREFRAKALFEANPQLHADIVPFVKATGGDLLDGERPGPASQVLLDKYRARYLLDVDSDGVNQIIVSLSDLARGVYPGAEVRSSLLKHP